MAISPARKLAYDILLAVTQRGAFASELLHAGEAQTLALPDRRLATEIVMGVLRRQAQLDFLIETASRRSLERLDIEVAIALRMGVYQLRYTCVPRPAAVHESVELSKRAHRRFASGLVNAVLRRIPDEPLETLVGSLPEARREAILLSHPHWLLERWRARFGDELTRAMASYDNRVPPTALRVDDRRLSQAAARRQLAAAGLECEPGALLASCLRVTTGDVTKTELFRGGAVWVQDEASQLIPLLLAVHSGQFILDACAAPGGKSAELRALHPDARLVSMDLHPHRARLLARLLREPQTWVIAADAARALPLNRQFERILVDAPCSGTGTLARNPEIRWKLRFEDLAALADRQTRILSNALVALAPGGRLVYSVCSLEPEEGATVVRAALPAAYRVIPVETTLRGLAQRGVLLAAPSALAEGEFLLIHPGAYSTDGFFAAVLERPA